MKNNTLHIIALNIPYPTNYGGAIDIFYKVKALSELGIKIHLHCFEYGRDKAEILNTLCETVVYYPRKMYWKNLLSRTPFIVKSRTSEKLLQNLISVEAPILFEGLHCCYYLNHPKLKDRKQFVRAHNIESDYYKLLAKSDSNLVNKLYLFTEYLKIRSFEKRINSATGVFAISNKDAIQLSKNCTSHLIRAFHSESELVCKPGIGSYAIYHGNLSVAENENAALFLCKKVFKHLIYDLVIVGSKPSNKLRKEVLKYSNIRLVENPEHSILETMIQDAQIQVLPTEQDTGIKLKLLKSLYHGRHCVVNYKMIAGTGLEDTCNIVESPKEWISKIKELKSIPFNANQISKRAQLLEPYNCKLEAKKMEAIIYPQE